LSRLCAPLPCFVVGRESSPRLPPAFNGECVALSLFLLQCKNGFPFTSSSRASTGQRKSYNRMGTQSKPQANRTYPVHHRGGNILSRILKVLAPHPPPNPSPPSTQQRLSDLPLERGPTYVQVGSRISPRWGAGGVRGRERGWAPQLFLRRKSASSRCAIASSTRFLHVCSNKPRRARQRRCRCQSLEHVTDPSLPHSLPLGC